MPAGRGHHGQHGGADHGVRAAAVCDERVRGVRGGELLRRVDRVCGGYGVLRVLPVPRGVRPWRLGVSVAVPSYARSPGLARYIRFLSRSVHLPGGQLLERVRLALRGAGFDVRSPESGRGVPSVQREQRMRFDS